jgi:hypothetical protein
MKRTVGPAASLLLPLPDDACVCPERGQGDMSSSGLVAGKTVVLEMDGS